jgi:large subunit ribosomal protein L22
VVDAIKDMALSDALALLETMHKRAARPVLKTLQSAIANAVHKANVSSAELRLKSLEVMEGPAMKRYHPSTRGRIHPYKKRTSHIRVVLETLEEKLEKGK